MTTKWDSFSHSQMETLVYPKTFGQYDTFCPCRHVQCFPFLGEHWTIYCTPERIDVKLIPTFFWNRC